MCLCSFQLLSRKEFRPILDTLLKTVYKERKGKKTLDTVDDFIFPRGKQERSEIA